MQLGGNWQVGRPRGSMRLIRQSQTGLSVHFLVFLCLDAHAFIHARMSLARLQLHAYRHPHMRARLHRIYRGSGICISIYIHLHVYVHTWIHTYTCTEPPIYSTTCIQVHQCMHADTRHRCANMRMDRYAYTHAFEVP